MAIFIGDDNDNILTGLPSSNDSLDGRLGADTMDGKTGNDTYYVDNAGDVIIERINGGSGDLIISSISYSLSVAVEYLTLSGSANIDGFGSSKNNILRGNIGNNGIWGNDGNDRIYGDSGLDALYGGNGDDLLDGGIGADIMAGGSGRDKFYIDDNLDEIIDAETGDEIYSSISFDLSGIVINTLTLIGSAGLSAYGNSSNNLLYGNAGHNVLDGRAGEDYMSGGRGQ